MTDRELIEGAAKAAGIAGAWDEAWCGFIRRQEGMRGTGPWSPLTSDADALRLAVNLHMTVRCYMGNTCAQIATPGQRYCDADETNHSDPAAATRRAIVRAAAAIGSPAKESA